MFHVTNCQRQIPSCSRQSLPGKASDEYRLPVIDMCQIIQGSFFACQRGQRFRSSAKPSGGWSIRLCCPLFEG